jgi:hypothetical protein
MVPFAAVVTVTVDGFTLVHGDDSGNLGWGGGLQLRDNWGGDSLFVVRHNTISNNYACQSVSCQGYGGGIMVYSGRAIIEDNTISNNIARWQGSGGGGGISIHGYADATIVSNTIVANTAVFSTTGLGVGTGGGVDLEYAMNATLRDNHIELNTAAVHGVGRGGGVYAAGALYDNVIVDNVASVNDTGFGGGVYAYHVGLLENNEITSNMASQNGDGAGGGIYALYLQAARFNTISANTATRGGGVYFNTYSGQETFSRNQVVNNRATGSNFSLFDGGGGIASAADWVEITHNEIVSNTGMLGSGVLITGGDRYRISENEIIANGNVSTTFFGGGLAIYTATGVIASNHISGNAATVGGGLYLWGRASPTMDRNIVVENQALGFFGAGGGLLINVDSGTIVTLTNHIIARNAAGEYGVGGGVCCWQGECRLFNNTIIDNDLGTNQEGVIIGSSSYAVVGVVRNNIIAGHSTGIWLYSGVLDLDYNDYFDNGVDLSGASPGAHDRTDDPAFVDRPGGDYHLTLGSPLIDQGDPGVAVDHDFEGDPRPRGGEIDIGADEALQGEIYVSIQVGSDLTGDGAPAHPFATVAKGLAEVQTGGAVYVGQGVYTERITVTRSVELLGGFDETDWSRDIAAHRTTLDAQGLGTVVAIFGQGVHVLVEGFTITGGEASFYGSGGGLAVYDDASATIRYNHITGNHAQNGGGGLLLWGDLYRESVIEANVIAGNTADGEFPYALLGPHTPQQGPEPGGGLFIGGYVRVVNNLVYGNSSVYAGGGMGIVSMNSQVEVYHNTIADNNGGGLYLSSDESSVHVYNNLIVGHQVGISATTRADWDYNGFYDNDANYASGLAAGAHDVSGNPRFVDRAGADFHILPGSPAQGAGLEFGVLFDFDGEPRPFPAGSMPDLGADEIGQGCMIYLPIISR